MDKVFSERLGRSLKYECVYLPEFSTCSDVRLVVDYCNQRRPHSLLEDRTPEETST